MKQYKVTKLSIQIKNKNKNITWNAEMRRERCTIKKSINELYFFFNILYNILRISL